MGGRTMGAITSNPLYSLLSEESQTTVNQLIDFLYYKESGSQKEETLQVINDAKSGKNLVGPFKSVDDLMRDLDA